MALVTREYIDTQGYRPRKAKHGPGTYNPKQRRKYNLKYYKTHKKVIIKANRDRQRKKTQTRYIESHKEEPDIAEFYY